MKNAFSDFTNLPEFSSHDGDEDLIELGRKFADAMERQEKYLHDPDDSNNGPFMTAVDDAFHCCEAGIGLKATTIIGLRVKAWLALYQCKLAGEDEGIDRMLAYSLFSDLVPAKQMRIPGDKERAAA